MGRSQETFNKKEVRSKKEKKRKAKEEKRLARKEKEKTGMDDMIAYVDENGMITSEPPDPDKKKRKTKLEDIEISIPKKTDADRRDPIRTGKVTLFNDSKGYGFIKDLETQESVFVHINNTLDAITVGDKVTFEVEKGKRGLAAIKVKLTK